MKFTVGESKRDLSEAVAYIDGLGDLVIRSKTGGCIYLEESGKVNLCKPSYRFEPENKKQVFFKGDSVTITF